MIKKNSANGRFNDLTGLKSYLTLRVLMNFSVLISKIRFVNAGENNPFPFDAFAGFGQGRAKRKGRRSASPDLLSGSDRCPRRGAARVHLDRAAVIILHEPLAARIGHNPRSSPRLCWRLHHTKSATCVEKCSSLDAGNGRCPGRRSQRQKNAKGEN